ncbi:hypothetical protein TIFTF001_039123 [Ficus carica]|uniref:Uncharacterized protein n=1 Tax=Ficus carica TaxID=3494 RepID=A0AA88EJD5_FICCA|nr:hypothetical protein TIFTF001_039121 [Ficus carica]GMN70079.1 hypothetical protein TIFTF001_039123 [Ficus carica]
MEARETRASSNGGEASMSEKKDENGSDEVVVDIRNESAESNNEKASSESSLLKHLNKVDPPQKVFSTESTGISKSVPLSCPSPEINHQCKYLNY